MDAEEGAAEGLVVIFDAFPLHGDGAGAVRVEELGDGECAGGAGGGEVVSGVEVDIEGAGAGVDGADDALHEGGGIVVEGEAAEGEVAGVGEDYAAAIEIEGGAIGVDGGVVPGVEGEPGRGGGKGVGAGRDEEGAVAFCVGGLEAGEEGGAVLGGWGCGVGGV